jgi:hypothetical protein
MLTIAHAIRVYGLLVDGDGEHALKSLRQARPDLIPPNLKSYAKSRRHTSAANVE